MYLDKNSEKKWLIKSENRILGPYNFEQIIDLLRKKQISIIDEVRDPETRWLYVRENSEFKNIVEEIRKEIDSRQESTKTYQSTTGTNTNTVTTTMTVPFDDISQKTRTDIVREETVTNAREVEIVAESYTPRADSPPVKVEKAKMYGVQTDSAVQSKLNDFSTRLKILVISVVVLVIGSYGAYIYYQKRNFIKKEEETVLAVKRYKYLGLYEKAAEIYDDLPDGAKRKLLPELLDMYPQLEKGGHIQMDDLKPLKSDTSLTAQERSNIELINFWQEVKQQNYGKAQEFLIKATALQPSALLVKENEALLNLKKGSFTEAYAQFDKLFNREKNGRYLYGMVLSYLGLADNDKATHMQKLLTTIERYTFIFFDFRKELLLAQVYLTSEFGQGEPYRQSLKQFFNTPVQLAKLYTRPSLLMPDVYNWKDLESIKSPVLNRLTGDENLLFQVHDLLEKGQMNAATNFIANNSAKLASPQIKAQMSLLMLNAQGRSKEILALDQSKSLDMNSELNHLLVSQNMLRVDPKRNIKSSLDFFDTRKEYVFYKDWLQLEQLVLSNSTSALKKYLDEHFLTSENFTPVFEARGLVNQ